MLATWKELKGMSLEEAKAEFAARGWECYYEKEDKSVYMEPELEPDIEYLRTSDHYYSDRFEATFENGICVECEWLNWED